MRWIAEIWAWCNATALHAYLTIALIGWVGLAFNGVARKVTPHWIAFVAARPRLAGLLLIAKGLFPEGATMARGAAAIVTGTLQARVSGAPPIPFSVIREQVTNVTTTTINAPLAAPEEAQK